MKVLLSRHPQEPNRLDEANFSELPRRGEFVFLLGGQYEIIRVEWHLTISTTKGNPVNSAYEPVLILRQKIR